MSDNSENKKDVKAIATALQVLFDLNGNNHIVIDMQPSEDVIDTVQITPCSQGDVVEYYLIEGASFMCYGGDTLKKVAESLSTYQEQYAESLVERTKLNTFKAEIEAMTDKEERLCAISTYSDWFKEVYGHRPHMEINQMLNPSLSEQLFPRICER